MLTETKQLRHENLELDPGDAKGFEFVCALPLRSSTAFIHYAPYAYALSNKGAAPAGLLWPSAALPAPPLGPVPARCCLLPLPQPPRPRVFRHVARIFRWKSMPQKIEIIRIPNPIHVHRKPIHPHVLKLPSSLY